MKIGIDLGGTNIAGGLVSDSGELIYKTSIPTATESEEALLSAIVKVVNFSPAGQQISLVLSLL